MATFVSLLLSASCHDIRPSFDSGYGSETIASRLSPFDSELSDLSDIEYDTSDRDLPSDFTGVDVDVDTPRSIYQNVPSGSEMHAGDQDPMSEDPKTDIPSEVSEAEEPPRPPPPRARRDKGKQKALPPPPPPRKRKKSTKPRKQSKRGHDGSIEPIFAGYEGDPSCPLCKDAIGKEPREKDQSGNIPEPDQRWRAHFLKTHRQELCTLEDCEHIYPAMKPQCSVMCPKPLKDNPKCGEPIGIESFGRHWNNIHIKMKWTCPVCGFTWNWRKDACIRHAKGCDGTGPKLKAPKK